MSSPAKQINAVLLLKWKSLRFSPLPPALSTVSEFMQLVKHCRKPRPGMICTYNLLPPGEGCVNSERWLKTMLLYRSIVFKRRPCTDASKILTGEKNPWAYSPIFKYLIGGGEVILSSKVFKFNLFKKEIYCHPLPQYCVPERRTT